MPAHAGTIATIARPNPPGAQKLGRRDKSDSVLRRGVPRWRSVVPVPSRGISGKSLKDRDLLSDLTGAASAVRYPATSGWFRTSFLQQKAAGRLVAGKAPRLTHRHLWHSLAF